MIARQELAAAQLRFMSPAVLAPITITREEERVGDLATELAGDVDEANEANDRGGGEGVTLGMKYSRFVHLEHLRFAVDDESWDDIIDSLEMDLFLSACAQRIMNATGESLEPDEIPARIRLIDDDGKVVVGAGGQYHSHAFYPEEDGVVPNAVMTANLMSASREDVTLLIVDEAAKKSKRGKQLPQV